MGFSCDCDDEGPAFMRVNEKRARRSHRCCECKETISAGHTYEHTSGKWEGEIETFRTCERCADLRASYLAMGYCVAFGTLWSDHYDMLPEGDSRARRLAESILFRNRPKEA